MSDMTMDGIDKALTRLLEGRRVASIDEQRVVLDDGTEVKLYCSDSDCCAGASGEWDWGSADREAMITKVELVDISEHEEYGCGYTTATLNILHNDTPIATGDCYADSGNGSYYFSVLSVQVAIPNGGLFNGEVISA